MRRAWLFAFLLALSSGTVIKAHEGHHHHHDEAAAQPAAAPPGEEAGSGFDPSLLGFSGLAQGYNVHPAFVHFPLALFPAAFLLYALGLLRREAGLNFAGRAVLYMACAGTLLAAATGLRAKDSFPHNEVIHRMMGTHETLGLALCGAAVVLCIWSFFGAEQRPRAAWLFLTVLGLSSLAALLNGDLGGRMVFIQGAAVKPMAAAMGER